MTDFKILTLIVITALGIAYTVYQILTIDGE